MKLSDIDKSTSLKQTNLVFLRRGDDLLLAMKKRGFGVGRWNGAGGKVELGESVEDAARREVREEIGVGAGMLAQVATLRFYFAPDMADPIQNIHCTVYLCEDWEGEPSESEEMAPQWYSIDSIPYEAMWPDDRYWLPSVLAGQCIEAEFLFGEGDEVLDMVVESK